MLIKDTWQDSGAALDVLFCCSPRVAPGPSQEGRVKTELWWPLKECEAIVAYVPDSGMLC